MGFEDRPGTIIGSEKYERILLNFGASQRIEYLPYPPVQFFNHITVDSGLTSASKIVRNEQRHVRHVIV